MDKRQPISPREGASRPLSEGVKRIVEKADKAIRAANTPLPPAGVLINVTNERPIAVAQAKAIIKQAGWQVTRVTGIHHRQFLKITSE